MPAKAYMYVYVYVYIYIYSLCTYSNKIQLMMAFIASTQTRKWKLLLLKKNSNSVITKVKKFSSGGIDKEGEEEMGGNGVEQYPTSTITPNTGLPFTCPTKGLTRSRRFYLYIYN